MSTSAPSGSALYKQLAEFPTYKSAQFQDSNGKSARFNFLSRVNVISDVHPTYPAQCFVSRHRK